jgi:hypothetical protein
MKRCAVLLDKRNDLQMQLVPGVRWRINQMAGCYADCTAQLICWHISHISCAKTKLSPVRFGLKIFERRWVYWLGAVTDLLPECEDK